MPKKHAHFARQTAAPRSWKTKRWWKLPESRSKWNLPGTGAVGGREMSRGRSFNWHHAGGHRCGRSSSMKGGGGKELSRWCELVESWLWWQLPLQGVGALGASSSWTFKSSLFFQIIDFHFRYFRLMIPFLNIVQRIWHLQRYLSQVRLRQRLGRWLRLDATSNKAGNSTRQSSGHQHLEPLGSCGADGWGERALARWDLVYIYIIIYIYIYLFTWQFDDWFCVFVSSWKLWRQMAMMMSAMAAMMKGGKGGLAMELLQKHLHCSGGITANVANVVSVELRPKIARKRSRPHLSHRSRI